VSAGVLGPRRKRWGHPVEGSLGPSTRTVDAHGGLVEIPLDRRLGVHGLTSSPLPRPLLAAATRLLDRLPVPAHTGGRLFPNADPEPLVDDQDC
jgi:hypothetical protein